MKLSQKTCLWKERIIFFGLKKDMSQSDETAAGTRLFRLIALYAAAGQTDALKAFYNTWADKGMNAWADQFENIA